jgi:hypothetical protein
MPTCGGYAGSYAGAALALAFGRAGTAGGWDAMALRRAAGGVMPEYTSMEKRRGRASVWGYEWSALMLLSGI